jgi:flagellar motility protein MotE (MotC chaperone)
MTSNKKNVGGHDSEMDQVEALKKIIEEAEKTITATKQKLAQIQGSKTINTRPETRNDEEGNVVYGVFDGQIMIGEDGKQYPVPSNYASKSKLVENDMLKLSITPTGNFIYKQVGPVERKYLIGIVEKDERGNFVINSEGKRYKTLLAAATYFKVEPGDEVTLVVPRDKESVWCAIENVLRKANDIPNNEMNNEIYERLAEVKKNEEKNMKKTEDAIKEEDDDDSAPSAIERLEKEMAEERQRLKSLNESDLSEEEIAALEKEASYPAK